MPMRLDACAYRHFEEIAGRRQLSGIVLVHVDDMLGTGDETPNGSARFAECVEILRQRVKFRT